MKLLLPGLLSLVILTALPEARAQQYGDYTYSINQGKQGGITITGYRGAGGAVVIPSEIEGMPVTTIGERAFADCYTLTNVTLPSTLTSIGMKAFSECTYLTAIAIPHGVTDIGGWAFRDCDGLTELTFPSTLTSIGSQAYANCMNLATVVIPRGVTNIGESAFGWCPSLASITVDAVNPAYSSEGGILFNKDHTTLLQWPTSRGGSYAIPGSVTCIGGGAFAICAGLTNVLIPNGVTRIGRATFMSCLGLTDVAVPAGVEDIGDYTFYYCASLTNLTLPESVTNLGSYALCGCSGLGSLTLPAHLACIADRSFIGCVGLTTLTIPGSVTYIGDVAFEFCDNLQALFFQGNAPGLGSFVFESPTIYYRPGTSGWGATFGNCPAVLWNPLLQAEDTSFGTPTNGFGFTITGTADIPLVLEAGTNLARGNWETLQRLSLTNGAVSFRDSSWQSCPARFYRIRSP